MTPIDDRGRAASDRARSIVRWAPWTAGTSLLCAAIGFLLHASSPATWAAVSLLSSLGVILAGLTLAAPLRLLRANAREPVSLPAVVIVLCVLALAANIALAFVAH